MGGSGVWAGMSSDFWLPPPHDSAPNALLAQKGVSHVFPGKDIKGWCPSSLIGSSIMASPHSFSIIQGMSPTDFVSSAAHNTNPRNAVKLRVSWVLGEGQATLGHKVTLPLGVRSRYP